MSQDTAVFAKGTKLELGDGATTGETFAEVKGITKYNPDPGGAGEPEKLPVTSGSTSGLTRETLDGYSDKRPGGMDLEMFVNMADTTHAALEAAGRSGADKHFKITVPTKSTAKVATWTGRVVAFPFDIPFDKTVSAKVKLSVNEGTWAWAS